MKVKKLDVFKFKDLVDKNVPFIVKFKNDGCYICEDLKPIYRKVATSFPDVGFYDVDTGEEEELAEIFIEDGVPTLYYINGKNFKELEYPKDGYDENNLTEIVKQILVKGKNED